MVLPGLSLALLDAIEEPALVIHDERVEAANAQALRQLGARIVGRDIRMVLRDPDALDVILPGLGGERDLPHLGGSDHRWTLIARPLSGGTQLVRLIDRSAERAADRMRVDFVANASHELRTPLTTMIGYAETLAEEGSIPDEIRMRFGGTIHNDARRMLRIIEDLMSLSRIEADRFRAPDGRLALHEIARVAADNGRSLAQQRDCTLKVDLSPTGTIAGDYGQLVQLADNLVGNAIRYGCKGPSGTVTIQTALENNRAILRVSDEGDGISAAHLPRITERFYRIDEARSRDSGGTGLGLSIVKHIAERHNAQLDIKSALGRGTTVTVAFPLLTPAP